ncbi:MAG: hypothetical protein R2838_16115 [Caldilineaceae bacterium]
MVIGCASSTRPTTGTSPLPPHRHLALRRLGDGVTGGARTRLRASAA